jgi:hypothetical protein
VPNRPGEADGGWRVGICLGAQAPQLTSGALGGLACKPVAVLTDRSRTDSVACVRRKRDVRTEPI